jgi:hypothetical protein
LNYDFSDAWISGRKPSPINEIIKKRLPIENKIMGLSTLSFYVILK